MDHSAVLSFVSVICIIFATYPFLLCHGCSVNLSSLCKCSVLQPTGDLNVECVFVNFTDVQEVLKEVTGVINKLTLKGLEASQLPSNAFGSATIRQLQISRSGLTTVDDEALASQKGTLTHLSLVNNSLTAIPNLKGFTRLASLDLGGNDISDVAPFHFSDSPNLQHLRLARNKICFLRANALNETKQSLTLMDLSGNCLGFVPANNLRGFQKLSWLDLSRNRINDLPNLHFMNILQLQDLWLDGNRIRKMAPLSFTNVPNLKRLFMRDNRLTNLEPNLLEPFENLEVLDMSGNRLSGLSSSTFHDMQLLSQVRLDDNLIEEVETTAFTNLPNLRLISLKNNKIRLLGKNSFDQLPQMSMLLLQNNSLVRIEQSMFAGMPNLQQLNLRNNQISRIAPGTFDLVPGLTTIDLGNNGVTELSQNLFADHEKLFWLDLSHNDIRHFPFGAFPRKIANLLLNGNPLECDGDLDWLIDYLVKNQIRTFLPTDSEAVCEGPDSMQGTRLKDLMIKKANESLFHNLETFKSFKNLIPADAAAYVNGLAPSNLPLNGLLGSNVLKGLPGMEIVPSALTTIPLPLNANPNSISGFTAPLSRIIANNEASESDVRRLIQGVPNFVQGLPPPGTGGSLAGLIPGLQGLTNGQIPPQLLQLIQSGQSIPGVNNALVQQLLQQHLKAGSLAGANSGPAAPKSALADGLSQTIAPALLTTLLPKISPQIVQAVLAGRRVQGLSDAQANAVKQFYLQQLTTQGAPAHTVGLITGKPLDSVPNQVNLPLPGLDLTKFSPEVLKDIAAGRLPDLRAHPEFLQILQDNPGLLTVLGHTRRTPKPNDDFGPGGSSNQVTDNELNLFQAATRNGPSAAASPYDIESIQRTSNSIVPDTQSRDAIWITGVIVGLTGFFTVVTIGLVCFQKRRRNRLAQAAEKDRLFFAGGSPRTRRGSLSSSEGGISNSLAMFNSGATLAGNNEANQRNSIYTSYDFSYPQHIM